MQIGKKGHIHKYTYIHIYTTCTFLREKSVKKYNFLKIIQGTIKNMDFCNCRHTFERFEIHLTDRLHRSKGKLR